MKIALVTEPLSGGVGRYVSELALSLDQRRHDVTVFYSPRRVEQAYVRQIAQHAGVKLVPLPIRRNLCCGDLLALFGLVRAIISHGPFDVVHAHSAKAGALVRIALFFSSVVVYSPHAVITLNPDLGRFVKWLYASIEGFLGRFSAGRVLACSDEESEQLVELGVPLRKIKLVLNGTPLDTRACDRDIRKALGLSPTDFCVGFVGRFAGQKRPMNFVRVIKALKARSDTVKAVMIGAGEQEGLLRAFIVQEGLEDCIKLMFSDDARKEIGAFDVLCITSMYEGFSLALLESLGLGVPVVTTAVGGARHALGAEECGYVIPEFDPEVFADRILDIRRSDQNRLAASCFERSVTQFAQSRMVDEIEAVYRSSPVRTFGFGRLRRLREASTALLFGLSFASFLLASSSVAAIGRVSLSPGAVVRPGSAIVVNVESSSGSVSWMLRDVHEAVVAQGRGEPTGGQARVEVVPPSAGYFEVEVADAQSSSRRALAVLEPHPSPSDRFGVMTHFAQGWDIGIIPRIRELGLRHVRDELYWAEIEKERGVYRSPPHYRRYMEELRSFDIEPLIVLSFENPLYDGGETPYTDEGRRAFGRYAVKLLDLHGDQIKRFEVWNEYNGSFCKGPCSTDRPRFYSLMLREAYSAIKKARPDVEVAGASTVLVPIPYFEGLIRNGALGAMDSISIHPYGSPPEQISRQVAALRRLLQTADGKPLRISATEIGYQLEGQGARLALADHLVRSMTLLLASGVEPIYWYLLRDYDTFEGMGLVRDADDPLGAYAPTPAFMAYATLIRSVDGAAFRERAPTDPRTHAYVFDSKGSQARVIWSTDGRATLVFSAEHPVIRVNVMGRREDIVPENGMVRIEAGPEPQFIIGNAVLREERRPDALVTDSDIHFDLQQGSNSWSYNAKIGSAQQLVPLVPRTDTWGTFWGSETDGHLAIGTTLMHPSARNDVPVPAVRRWTSDKAGPATIRGSVKRPSQDGDGSGFKLVLDGHVLFERLLGRADSAGEVTFALDVKLQRGSVLDVEVTPGAATDINYDAVQVHLLVAAGNS